ncbi:sensor domain-containing phosphodiesterase [Pseudokordiimonas caeni]|uniref:sensor domain-containing phosphodiesterase n=1 Tax=Pseudokordiimonas caeni TaxID=2997908 RepID=UPI00281230A5|nr:EAL domain-containing protein [Pseudokordiimonas caeni]
MTKIPERFVGYAFCVGDLLLELDRDFTILSADGASQSLLGKVQGPLVGKNFMSLLGASDRKILETTAKTLSGKKMRSGPFTVKVGQGEKDREPFSIFIGALPMRDDRLYLVMARPHRIGLKPETRSAPQSVAEAKADFYENLQSVFTSDPEAQENLLVTVLQSIGKPFSENQQAEVERYLKSCSVGGNLATRLGDDKFALVHEKDEDGSTIALLTHEISEATGVKIDSATIDAHDAHLAEEDSIKALVFSLQQFTRAQKGFALKDLKAECGKMIGDNTKKLREFRQVLKDGAFSLVFQPIVEFKTGKTHHFEALSRLQLSDVNASPFEMITFAEDVGLIDEFDMAVLRRAIAKLAESEKSGHIPKLAVNVSGRSLSDRNFIKKLLLELHNADRYRDFLSLEVTESARIDDLAALGRVLGDIRNAGFKVYLDDFGAGAAGFQYLRELQVDALKIDGVYIRNAVDSAKDRAFLRSMVTLCQDLGIETVGEWVETQAHAALLRDLGVDYGQGYFFGKPVSGLVPARVGKI